MKRGRRTKNRDWQIVVYSFLPEARSPAVNSHKKTVRKRDGTSESEENRP